MLNDLELEHNCHTLSTFFCTIIVQSWETSLGPRKRTQLFQGEILHFLVKKKSLLQGDLSLEHFLWLKSLFSAKCDIITGFVSVNIKTKVS